MNRSRIPFRHSGVLHIVPEHIGARKAAHDDSIPSMSEENYIPTKYDSVFWVEVDRISPNPYQPRVDFNEENLKSLADSIRQYGVLMPLVVTRKDIEKPDGGIQTAYELIAGERRLRASKLVGLKEVPVVIRAGEQTDRMKLELAIIENLQREDLNAIDRARALAQLAENFGLSHAEIGAKVGKSREYVSNSIRLLALPDAIQQAVVGKEITEGHARALLMLSDRPEEQDTLFKEIMLKKTTVRFVEQMARRIATDKIRKHDKTPEMMELERSLTETLGTRVMIENRPNGGRVMIEFFSPEDLSHIAAVLAERREQEALLSQQAAASVEEARTEAPAEQEGGQGNEQEAVPNAVEAPSTETTQESQEVPASETSTPDTEDDLYSVRGFTV